MKRTAAVIALILALAGCAPTPTEPEPPKGDPAIHEKIRAVQKCNVLNDMWWGFQDRLEKNRAAGKTELADEARAYQDTVDAREKELGCPEKK